MVNAWRKRPTVLCDAPKPAIATRKSKPALFAAWIWMRRQPCRSRCARGLKDTKSLKVESKSQIPGRGSFSLGWANANSDADFMSTLALCTTVSPATPLVRVASDPFEAKLENSIAAVQRWVEKHGYKAYDPGDGNLSYLHALTF